MRGLAWIGLVVVALSPGSARPAAPGRPPGPGAGAAVTEQASELTGDQMIERYRRAVAQIHELAGEVQAKLSAARAARDTIRANCLDERLGQVKGLLKSGEAAAAVLKAAADKHDSDAMAREYANIAAGRKKVDEVVAAANECVGQSAGDDSRIAIDTLQPELEEESRIEPQTVPFVRPAAASPTK